MPDTGITVGFILPGGKYVSWIFPANSVIEVLEYDYFSTIGFIRLCFVEYASVFDNPFWTYYFSESAVDGRK